MQYYQVPKIPKANSFFLQKKKKEQKQKLSYFHFSATVDLASHLEIERIKIPQRFQKMMKNLSPASLSRNVSIFSFLSNVYPGQKT